MPRFGNPTDPLDDLIYVILSTRTAMEVARRVFKQLKMAFSRWDDLQRSSHSRLRRILKPAGLSAKKSAQIIAAVRQIKKRFGRCDLRALRAERNDAIEEFLVSLPGVSEKVAKCVMIYAMHRKVLPVDVHVYRVSRRLGWIDRNRADQCHRELEALITPNLRHGYHVGCVAHGRTICGSVPKCSKCPINKCCDFYKSRDEKKKTHRNSS